MNRRRFSVGLGLVTLLTCFPRCGCAKQKLRGCALNLRALQQNGNFLLPSSGSAELDRTCLSEVDTLNKVFGVKASFSFFDDVDGANAFASTNNTVVFGKRLAARLLESTVTPPLCAVAIMAHEWGHILQFSQGAWSSWTVKDELSADYLAGWYLARTRARPNNAKDETANLFASLGDTEFYNPDYHGTPSLRSKSLLLGRGFADRWGASDSRLEPVPSPAEALSRSREYFSD